MALISTFQVTDALREARPAPVAGPPIATAAPVVTRREADAVTDAVRDASGPAGASLPLATALEVVRSLVDAGTISVAAGRDIAEKLTDTAIDSGGQIAVNTVEQILERLLKGEVRTATSPSGDTIIQTCAPTLACPYEK